MNQKEKDILKDKILSRQELYELQGSRLRRLLKDPLRTIPYYIMQFLAYRKPYKVSYTTLWGDTMRFYLPEAGAIYYYGFFEANLSNFFINFLKEGDTFFDIGAHVGYYSMLSSALVGESGKVVSFEPTPRTFKSLQENAKTKKNIQVYNNAVMDKETEIEFFDYGPKFSAFNSFKKRTSEEIYFRDDAVKITVKTVAIDSFCKMNQFLPTLIKIDAEGSEHLILEAMSQVLDEIRPLVTIEVSGGEEWKDNCMKSIKILQNKGYECYEISLPGYLTKHIVREVYTYDNLLFVHPSKRLSIASLIK
jgi:FkbM family methyltransferase